MLNGVHEKIISKAHNVKDKLYPGAASDDILDKVDDLVKNKPDCLFIHATTNAIVNNLNLFNSVKKIVQKVKNHSQTQQLSCLVLLYIKTKRILQKS